MACYEDFFKRYARFGIKPGLERITALLGRLENPQQGFKSVHIAGTNGKGSVAAMLEAVLRASGLKTGLFTSPHLSKYSERIRINGEPIPDFYVEGFIKKTEPILDRMDSTGMGRPTEFELLTALAFDWFTKSGVDIGIIEVGLGGRLDSTNCITPLVSVITSISIDHTNILGKSLGKIAYEKAGIIKPGVPVVSAGQDDSALKVIEDKAAAMGSLLYLYGNDFNSREKRLLSDGQVIDIDGISMAYEDAFVPFLGRHQQENAALAVAAAEILASSGYDICPEHILQGIKTARWPGRAEVLCKNPTVIIDGAHNQSGVKALVSTLEDFFPGRRRIMVAGMLKDKDWVAMINDLAERADVLIATAPYSHRGLDPKLLALEVEKMGVKTSLEPDPEEAVKTALKIADKQDVVCITGSLYLIGHIRDFLLDKQK